MPRCKANTTYKWRFTPDGRQLHDPDRRGRAAVSQVQRWRRQRLRATTPSRQLPGLAAPFLPPAMSAFVRVVIRPSPSPRIRAMLLPMSRFDGKSIGAVKSYTFENVSRPHTIRGHLRQGHCQRQHRRQQQSSAVERPLLASTLTLAGAVLYKRKRCTVIVSSHLQGQQTAQLPVLPGSCAVLFRRHKKQINDILSCAAIPARQGDSIMKRITRIIRPIICMAVLLFAMTTAVMGCYQKETEPIDIPGRTPSGTSAPQPSALMK